MATFSMVDGDWTVDRQTGNIRYTGDDHNGANPSYATTIQFHRWLQGLADNPDSTGSDDELDISDVLPSSRATDNYITLLGDYNIDKTASEHLYDGSVEQGTGGTQEIYDGLVNFGNASAHLQIIQDGDIIADDFWNYSLGGTATAGSATSNLEDLGETWTTDEWVGYTIKNTTDGSYGIITANTAEDITAVLFGGTNNVWTSGDNYLIGKGLNGQASQGISHRFMLQTRKTRGSLTMDGASTTTTVVHDTTAQFKTWGVRVGDKITNGTVSGTPIGTVTSIQSETQLTLSSAITGQAQNDTYAISHDINDRKLLGTSRRFSNTFSEFSVNGTARGNNVLALNDASDLNNSTAVATVDGWTDVYIQRTTSTATVSGVNSTGQADLVTSDGTQFTAGDFIMIAGDQAEYQILSIATNTLTLNRNLQVATAGSEAIYDLSMGFTALNIDDIGGTEDYYSVWTKGAQSINNYFERMKFISSDSTEHYVYGISGELFRGITHEITIDTNTGTFAPAEEVTWGTATDDTLPYGKGQMIAIDSPTAGTKMWIQLLTGVAPTDGMVITGSISGATSAVNVTVTDRSSLIKTPFVGASTGSALIGSYGLALIKNDLTKDDKVFDLTNTQITPPNIVTFTLNDASAGVGNDYAFMAEWDGSSSDINGDPEANYNQMAINTILDADNETSVVIGHVNGDETTIPSDTPTDGYLRVVDDNGYHRKLHYSAHNGTNTFTIDTTDGNEDFLSVNASVGNNVYLTYMDKVVGATSETFSYTYNQTNGDRQFVIKVRYGDAGAPIKEYIATGKMQDTGGSATVIRTSDS